MRPRVTKSIVREEIDNCACFVTTLDTLFLLKKETIDGEKENHTTYEPHISKGSSFHQPFPSETPNTCSLSLDDDSISVTSSVV